MHILTKSRKFLDVFVSLTKTHNHLILVHQWKQLWHYCRLKCQCQEATVLRHCILHQNLTIYFLFIKTFFLNLHLVVKIKEKRLSKLSAGISWTATKLYEKSAFKTACYRPNITQCHVLVLAFIKNHNFFHPMSHVFGALPRVIVDIRKLVLFGCNGAR